MNVRALRLLLARITGRPFANRGAARTLTLDKAHAALQQGQCMYALSGRCSGPPRSVGLRHKDDDDHVLACKAHVGKLGELRRNPRDLTLLHEHLTATRR